MLKLCEWLVICIVSPYKNLGHFIKCLAILFSRHNKNTEKKIGKIKKTRKEKRETYLAAQLTQPAQPISLLSVVFLPAPPSYSVQSHRRQRRHRCHCGASQPSRCPSSLQDAPRRCPGHVAFIRTPWRASSFLLR